MANHGKYKKEIEKLEKDGTYIAVTIKIRKICN